MQHCVASIRAGLLVFALTVAAAMSGDARLPRLMIVPPVLPEGLSADLHTIRAHDAARAPLFCTKDFIIDACPVRPPERDPALLVLTAADLSRTQPRRSSLYLVDLAPPYTSRRLSPEEHYNFWDISVGDVDGDGAQDVALCTFSRTALTPRYARRFFIYSFDEHGDLYPRWRGSRLCRPYETAFLADVSGDEAAELVSVEYGTGGGMLLCAYEWNQFGFWGLGHSDEFARMRLVRAPASAHGPKGRALVEVDSGLAGARCVVFELADAAWHRVPADGLLCSADMDSRTSTP